MSVAIAAQAQGAVPNPAIQGPIEGGIHGYPWNHSLFPLSAKGYSCSENEYFFGGSAANLEKGVSAPYESRMLVRLPTDPAKFNGTVIVEWVNVTGQKDIETLWPIAGEYLMQHGYGYVVVDAQLLGVCCGPMSLTTRDPEIVAECMRQLLNCYCARGSTRAHLERRLQPGVVAAGALP